MTHFNNDVFISYAHKDNIKLLQSDPPWINTFHGLLSKQLAQLLGKDPRIWRDPKLQGNDIFSEVLKDELTSAWLFVSILSPSYLQSEWCTKELELFCEACQQQTGGVQVGNKSRILKVEKMPVDRQKLPEPVQPLLGFKFYEEADEEGGMPFEYSPLYQKDWERKLATRTMELAQAIKVTLADESIWKSSEVNAVAESSATVAAPEPYASTVYLAETTLDLADARAQVLNQLQQWGHRVLPERSCQLPSPEYEQAVMEDLALVDLSIHLVGNRYGMIPEGQETEQKSIVELQHDLACQRATQTPSFRYLVWMPNRLESQDIKQPNLRGFIETLQKDPNLLQISLEDLKEEIKTILQRKPGQDHFLEETTSYSNQKNIIYLICTPDDLDGASDVADIIHSLSQQGFDVTTSEFGSHKVQDRTQHQNCLRCCDAVLIYYGTASELWLQSKLAELRKAPGYGRADPFLAIAVYTRSPIAPASHIWLTKEVLLIQGASPFDFKSLQPLLDCLVEVTAKEDSIP